MGSASSINLRIPGPTPLSPHVLAALSRQMINHRGHAYEEIQARTVENLKYFFQTKNEIYLLTASGMGGLEAAIVNVFSPGDRIVALTIGEFGNRWAELARRFGADLLQIKFPPGQSVNAGEISRVLGSEKKIAGVLITHNETASGVLNNVKILAPLIKSHRSKPLLLVDSISALGAADLPMDKLKIDVLVTASQKAWMAPPGLAMISLSPQAWERQKTALMPRYYFDLSMYKEFAAKNQTPATPAVGTLFGLDSALIRMKREGRENIYRRHLTLMRYFRQEVENLGLTLFAKESDASPTVTSITLPDGIDGKRWLDILREKYQTVLAGGMGETKGKIIRVAHMGYVSKQDLEKVVNALKQSLSDVK